MKRQNRSWYGSLPVLVLWLAAALTACTSDPIEYEGGSGAPIDPIGESAPRFYSALTTRDSVARVWVEAESTFEDVVTLSMPKLRDEDLTVTLSLVENEQLRYNANVYYSLREVDLAVNGAYAPTQRIDRALFLVPADHVTATLGEQTIPAGENRLSIPVRIDLKGVGDPALNSSFLVILQAETVDAAGNTASSRFYYELMVDPVTLRQYPERIEGHGDSYMECGVIYIDPSWLDPRACLEPVITYTDPSTWETIAYEYCDIVVILGGSVGYDPLTQMPLLNIDRNLMHLLDNADRYLRPIQTRGVKVTFELTGAGSGMGFCNLDDAQRASLVAEIARVVEKYGIDGVNLNDEYTNYGANGLPGIDPASYAKFIRDLRTALPDKTITLTDLGEPSATLYEAHDGIEAGAYLDYAWTGTAADLTDPYAAGASRKPIAGLPRQCYGRFTVRARDIGVWDEAQWDDSFNEMMMEIVVSDDPRILVEELMPTIEGNENNTGSNLGMYLGYMLPWTDGGMNMPWLNDAGGAIAGALSNPYAQYQLPGYGNMFYYPDWLRFD